MTPATELTNVPMPTSLVVDSNGGSAAKAKPDPMNATLLVVLIVVPPVTVVFGRAIIFNVLGLLDLVVAVGLGMTISPGPTQLFQLMPSGEVLTHFPLVLVPTFLVPLAVMVHVVSLRQLLGAPWRVRQPS